MNSRSVFAEHRTKTLFLLVGTNPLPNFISALFLAENKGLVFLLHSGMKEGAHTERIAKFLKDGIETRRPHIKVLSRGIDGAYGVRIESHIGVILDYLSLPVTEKIGLNYTSGTKPMAIHTYNSLKSRFGQNVTCSYLDARQLAFYIEGASGNPYPANHAIHVSLSELAALHGYQMNSLRQEPQYVPLVNALATVHETNAGAQSWFNWRQNEFRQSELPDSEKYPELQPAIEVFDFMCDGHATPLKIADKFGFGKFSSCGNWFKGPWLEELALMAVIGNADEFKIKHYGIDLKPYPTEELALADAKNFQLDVAAMVGYQLFAISCIASTKSSGETKKHLLEAYVRARQLGGDEARIGLITCVSDPHILQDEINRDWHTAGKIRVFGQKDLLYLGDEFREWFATANQ